MNRRVYMYTLLWRNDLMKKFIEIQIRFFFNGETFPLKMYIFQGQIMS